MLKIVSLALTTLIGSAVAQSSSSSYYKKPSSSSSSYYKAPSSSSYYKAPSSSSYYKAPSSSSYYKAPSSSSYYTKPSTSYTAPSSSYYTAPSSSYYKAPSSSSYYVKPSSSSYYVKPSSGYYVQPSYTGSGSYYNTYYNQAYGYNTYGYNGGVYGTGQIYGYNAACPYGCTINGFCGSQQQCASSAIGAILGGIFGLIVVCILVCVCCCICRNKDGGKGPQTDILDPSDSPRNNADAPFEGTHNWQGEYYQNGMGAQVFFCMTVEAGEISGGGNDPVGHYSVYGDTDGHGINFRKEYPGQPPVFYECHLVGDRRRIEGQYGFAPGQMVENCYFNLMD